MGVPGPVSDYVYLGLQNILCYSLLKRVSADIPVYLSCICHFKLHYHSWTFGKNASTRLPKHEDDDLEKWLWPLHKVAFSILDPWAQGSIIRELRHWAPPGDTWLWSSHGCFTSWSEQVIMLSNSQTPHPWRRESVVLSSPSWCAQNVWRFTCVSWICICATNVERWSSCFLRASFLGSHSSNCVVRLRR